MSAPPLRRTGRAIALMLAVGIALGWASVFLIPHALQLGMPAQAADRIPFVGFAVGVALGFGFERSANVKQGLSYVSLPLILGVVCWCLGLLIGALLLVLGASEAFVDHLPTAGFGLGVLLGIVPLFGWGYDVLGALSKRLRKA